MKDLYGRLAKLGFNAKFLRDAVFPDWWQDSMAEVPANRALAEAAISKLLGFPIRMLRDPEADLPPISLQDVRLKHNRNIDARKTAPALLIIQKVARILAGRIREVPAYSGDLTSSDVRQEILRHATLVDLTSLVDFCWRSGIPVVHVGGLPSLGKRVDGSALNIEGRPFIVLASGRDSPSWLAFILAHELAHIMLGHVTGEQMLRADTDLIGMDDDLEEMAANDYALGILSGASLPIPGAYGIGGRILANWAEAIADKRGIDPGHYALVFGRIHRRYGVAQEALKYLRLDKGGREIIVRSLGKHLDMSELSETAERFISTLTAVS